ncbi:hypothetical protein Taro_019670 [Colocasia esculenta]|uniref:Uncharacterized protein n=1 Tax=Colocasia esculenta TaxID=4460 RepID=A0A843UXG2_COLES|nr:hypothetical protein [Colocasia esculenta]
MGLVAVSLAVNLGLLGLRNCPRFQPIKHPLLCHATHGAVPNGQMGHLGTPLTQFGAGDANLMNLTAGFVDVYCDGSLNSIRVDTNLCDLQNIGLPEDNSLSSFSLSLAMFSCPLLPYYFQQL